jgi:asparagine synthase (glutamine-hydrolysing)
MKEISALKEAIPDEGAIAFSGGLDSSLIGYLAVKNGRHIGYVAGVEGSHDIIWAEKAAELISLPLKKIIVDEEDIRKAYLDIKEILDTDNLVVISFEMPLYFVAMHCKEDTIITGQGADEIFGGYSRYERMDRDTLEKEMKKDLEDLINYGIHRDRAIAKHFGKTLVTPYLSDKFLKIVTEIPPYERKGSGRKDMLRKISKDAGLPMELWMKEKKAAQYGSGIMKILKKIARD